MGAEGTRSPEAVVVVVAGVVEGGGEGGESESESSCVAHRIDLHDEEEISLGTSKERSECEERSGLTSEA